MNDAQKTLRDYVEKAKAQGTDMESLRTQLLSVGWSADDVESALKASISQVPMPPSVNVSSGLDIALYLGIFITLYASVIDLGTLVFQLINKAFVDPLQARMGYYASSSVDNLIRFSAATVIVAFPLFLWLSSIVRRHIKENPVKMRVAIRRSLTYFTLFVAGIVVMSSLISIVYTFLGGDLQARFLLKALTVLVLGGAVFAYYYPDARNKFTVK